MADYSRTKYNHKINLIEILLKLFGNILGTVTVRSLLYIIYILYTIIHIYRKMKREHFKIIEIGEMHSLLNNYHNLLMHAVLSNTGQFFQWPFLPLKITYAKSK